MNEVDLVRALMPEHQGPTATATRQAQARLSAGISRARQALGRPWWTRRNIIVPALATVAAAAAAAAAILVAVPATEHGSNDQAAVLLADHAAAAAGHPAIPDRQWLYQKVVVKKPDGSFRTGISWIRSGTGEMAEKGGNGGSGFASGNSIPPGDFGQLPSEPHALIRYLAALAGSGQGDQGAFLMIEGTFIDGAPSAVAAKLYRALGDIPGVTVNHDAVDVAGRHGIAFARGGQEIILSNGSYQFMGFVTDGAAGHPALDGEAILQRVPVSGAFVLP